jgi:hypothetical protein
MTATRVTSHFSGRFVRGEPTYSTDYHGHKTSLSFEKAKDFPRAAAAVQRPRLSMKEAGRGAGGGAVNE